MRLPPWRKLPAEALWAGGLGGAFLALYIATLEPGAVGGDPGEFQLVPYILGIPHQTGYPLMVLLGKLWTLIFPVGSIAYRMNLFSALFAAASVALMYPVARRLGLGRCASLLAGISLGLMPLFWELGTVAGVRSLSTFMALAVIWLALHWRQAQPHPQQAHRAFLALAFTAGLSLTHHRSVIFVLPVVVCYLALVRWPFWTSWRELALAGGLTMLPLGLYLYLPVRSAMNPPFAWTRADSLSGFLNLALAGGAGENLQAIAGEKLPARLDVFFGLALRQLTPLGAALALLGVGLMAHRDGRNLFLVAVPALGISALSLAWTPMPGKLNPVFLITALPFYALLLGAGADLPLRWFRRLLPRKSDWTSGIVGLAFLAYLACIQGRAGLQMLAAKRQGPLDNFRQELRGQNAQVFAQAALHWADQGALIACDWEQETLLQYYRLVEGKRPDLEVQWPITEWRSYLSQARSQGRKLYLARALPEAIGEKFLTNAGPLVEIREGPELELPRSLEPLHIQWEDKLELVGLVRLSSNGQPLPMAADLSQGQSLRLLLYWRALPGLQADYSLSLRLVDFSGKVLAQKDAPRPVLALYPTSLWTPDEVVADYHELAPPGALPPGTYRLQLLVYRGLGEGRWENLQLARAPAGTVEATLASWEIR